MIKFANKSSFNNQYKIILINKSEFLNKSSSNAILKILEEPSANTIFLILQNSRKKNLKIWKALGTTEQLPFLRDQNSF